MSEWVFGEELLSESGKWKLNKFELLDLVQKGLQPHEIGTKQPKPAPDYTKMIVIRKKIEDTACDSSYWAVDFANPENDVISVAKREQWKRELAHFEKQYLERKKGFENYQPESWANYEPPESEISGIISILISSIFKKTELEGLRADNREKNREPLPLNEFHETKFKDDDLSKFVDEAHRAKCKDGTNRQHAVRRMLYDEATKIADKKWADGDEALHNEMVDHLLNLRKFQGKLSRNSLLNKIGEVAEKYNKKKGVKGVKKNM